MSRWKIISLVVALILTVVVVRAALHRRHGSGVTGDQTDERGTISHYTCPMHPHIHSDRPGSCPICQMKLVPVYQEPQGPATGPAGHGEGPHGGPSVLISPERQQLIGIRTVPAARRAAVKEIRTVGRVAFDPDLAVAQREFVEIARNVPAMRAAAVSRLKLLGMGDEEIAALEKKGSVDPNLILPGDGDPVWVYATLYTGEMDLVKPGTEAEILLPSPGGIDTPDGTNSPRITGTVRAIDPVVDPMTRSVRARIEVPGLGGKIRPDSYVTALIRIDLGEALLIPKSAVLATGTRKIAFVVHEGRHFQTREIETGPEAGDEVVVRQGIEEGEKVVTSATFLVDSESQLKAAVAGMGEHAHGQ